MVQCWVGEKNILKSFILKTFKQHKTKKFQCIVTILYCIFPSLFAVCVVVGLREREEFCIPVIWITEVLLDLSDTSHLNHSTLSLGPTALIYMGSLMKTIRCFFEVFLFAYIGNS